MMVKLDEVVMKISGNEDRAEDQTDFQQQKMEGKRVSSKVRSNT